MTVLCVNVKWQKEKFKGVECDTKESVENFRAQLYSLTGVPPERQKIMLSGQIIENTFEGISIKDGSTIMLMGTSEISQENKGDSAAKVAKIEAVKPVAEPLLVSLPGLTNLGNTCYMNSVVQALFHTPELTESLKLANFTSSRAILPQSLNSLFNDLSKSVDTIQPIHFLICVHKVFPQFGIKAREVSEAEGGGSGAGFQQQDANEFMLKLFHELQNVKISLNSSSTTTTLKVPSFIDKTGEWNPIDKYFTGTMDCNITCDEDETDTNAFPETFLQVPCFINKDIKYLQTGIKNSLESKMTKMSSKLNKDASYTKKSLFSRLPAVLTIQFVRFFYKEKQKINAKILKDVKFPINLDMYEFCTDELKKKMDPMREEFRKEDEREAQAVKIRKNNNLVDENKKPDFYEDTTKYEPYWFEEDIGSNNSGFYQLQAVITHQGRSSSQAHYVAWCRHKDIWYKLDDDDVTIVSEEDILRLSGGGDWHCAYLLLYGPRKLLKTSNDESKPVSTTPMETDAK